MSALSSGFGHLATSARPTAESVLSRSDVIAGDRRLDRARSVLQKAEMPAVRDTVLLGLAALVASLAYGLTLLTQALQVLPNAAPVTAAAAWYTAVYGVVMLAFLAGVVVTWTFCALRYGAARRSLERAAGRA
ncbi:hypothetical protein HQQ81_21015 [Microbacteriaceae bacterium VKM Ac-2854]|nr:hypothetical protein [Microbacteriaceae bacterium VKM Ac-2854]